ncbi:hypothetical protein KTJ87_11545 [Rhodobacteraceae bacterium ASV31]|nr:hypothetical protein [Anianabacter salinae]
MVLSLATLAACTPQPMTLERAERLCREELPLADGFAGTVGVGVGNTGARARGGITVTNAVLNPQSPSEFMADCVARQMENRPAPTTFGVTLGTG